MGRKGGGGGCLLKNRATTMTSSMRGEDGVTQSEEACHVPPWDGKAPTAVNETGSVSWSVCESCQSLSFV